MNNKRFLSQITQEKKKKRKVFASLSYFLWNDKKKFILFFAILSLAKNTCTHTHKTSSIPSSVDWINLFNSEIIWLELYWCIESLTTIVSPIEPNHFHTLHPILCWLSLCKHILAGILCLLNPLHRMAMESRKFPQFESTILCVLALKTLSFVDGSIRDWKLSFSMGRVFAH